MAQSRGEHARKIDTPMLFVVLVLDRRHRVVQNFGTLLVRHQNAPLQRETADQLPVVGIHFGHNVRPVCFERANLRQIAGVHEEQSASCAQ
jgi:hypothetical protein